MAGFAAFILICLLFSALKRGAREATAFARPYIKKQGILVLVVIAAFIALASAGNK